MKVTDRVTFEAEDWIVQRIEEQGLERRLSLRKPRLDFQRPQFIDPPQPEPPAIVSAVPFAKLLDVPELEHLDSPPPYIAASANPWRQSYSVKVGADPLALTERAVVTTSAGIGRLETDLAAGMAEQWDETARFEVFLPDETLASLPQSAVEAGQNWLLIERAGGWEILAWAAAELIGPSRWTLSGILRGLAGTEPLAAPKGAAIILADSRLISLRLTAREVGQTLVWRLGTGDVQDFAYQDVAGRFA